MYAFESQSEEELLLGGVSPQQEQAVLLLASGRSQSFVSEKVGISRRTLYAWIHEDEGFQRALKRVRKEVQDQAFSQLGAVSGLALDRLSELIQSSDEKVSLEAVKYALAAGNIHY